MNPIKLAELFNDLPDGVGIDKRRQRLTALFGIAASTCVPLADNTVPAIQLRGYFNDNLAGVRAKLFKVNETLVIDVDRAVDYAFRIYENRCMLANTKNPNLVLSDVSPCDFICSVVPGFRELCIVPQDLANALDVLCEE